MYLNVLDNGNAGSTGPNIQSGNCDIFGMRGFVLLSKEVPSFAGKQNQLQTDLKRLWACEQVTVYKILQEMESD